MNSPLLKLVMFFGILLSINNAFAVCWPWDSCSSRDMNISIQNDTKYVLSLNNLSTHRASTVAFPVIMQPGEQQNLGISLSGASDKSVNANVNFDVLAAVSADSSKYIKIDAISQMMHGSFTCIIFHKLQCLGGKTTWKNLVGFHTWYIDPLTDLSAASLDGISLNISNQGNNTYVYDYTMASNNPTNLPPGSNPWGNTEYAPSPYQNN